MSKIPSISSLREVGDKAGTAVFPEAGPAMAAYISSEPLDMVGMLQRAHDPGAGAVVLFSGEVRDNQHGRPVAWLEYEAHIALAVQLIGEILEAARVRWELKTAMACHRIGRVGVGETAVVVITAAAHRGEAYEANRYIIDRIKHEAPIWKCEYFTDGGHAWGNNCACGPAVEK